jgi:hypothetical protein
MVVPRNSRFDQRCDRPIPWVEHLVVKTIVPARLPTAWAADVAAKDQHLPRGQRHCVVLAGRLDEVALPPPCFPGACLVSMRGQLYSCQLASIISVSCFSPPAPLPAESPYKASELSTISHKVLPILKNETLLAGAGTAWARLGFLLTWA